MCDAFSGPPRCPGPTRGTPGSFPLLASAVPAPAGKTKCPPFGGQSLDLLPDPVDSACPSVSATCFAKVVRSDLALQCVDPVGNLTTVDAALGYDPADPFAVTATFRTCEGDVTWTSP